MVLVLPAIIFSMWTSSRVNRVFKKYQNQQSSRRITGAQAARTVLNSNGLGNIPIDRITGKLTDHYDPTANVIRLSNAVYDNTSTVAIGIACHEVGHAIQHKTGYAPVKVRTAIVPITNFGARISPILIIAGLLLGSLSYHFTYLTYIGIALFALCTFFQLITLPTEFNASKRALQSIRSNGFLTAQEMVSAKEILNAAALTYVAALTVSLMQLLRFITLLSRRRR
jgi:Zn-dependent membrane protease YugP